MAKPMETQKWLDSACAKYDNRPILQYIWKNEDFAVSADGYRAHYVFCDDTLAMGYNHSKRTLKQYGNIELSDVLGRYPDMLAIKNSRSKLSKTVTLDKDTIAELIKAIKIARVFAKDSADSVLFAFYDGTVTVKGKSAERGDVETIVEIKGQHAFVELSANGHYMIDALKGFSHDSVTLYLSEENPIHFESKDRYAIVMPFSK